MSQVYNSKITAELFTPGSYLLNRKADTIKSRWGQHCIYLVSSPISIFDKLTQMVAFPILRITNPLRTPIVHAINGNGKKAIFHFLAIPLKWATAIPICLTYEIKKTTAIALELSLIPTVTRTVLGRDFTDFYFVERDCREHLEILNLRNEKVLSFPSYISESEHDIQGCYERLNHLNKFCRTLFWMRNGWSHVDYAFASLVKDCTPFKKESRQ